MERPSPPEVAEMLAQRRGSWLPQAAPNGRLRAGVFYLGDPDGNPGDSLPVPLKAKGRLRDFAADWTGDDLALFTRLKGYGDDQAKGYAAALELLGYGPRLNGHARPATRPAPAVSATRAHYSGSWVYTDEQGDPWIEVCRFDPPGQRKLYLQFNLREKKWTGREGGTLPEPRPLYNLPAVLAAEGRLVFVAGEKCADALAELGIVATTNLGGELALGHADLRPLRDRTVWIWPDADEAGARWRDDLANRLRVAGAVPLIVPVPGQARDKWDAADAILEDGWDADRVGALIDQARPAPTRLVCVSALEFVSMELPPRAPLFGPFLTKQALVMVYAARGIGKTWVAMNIAWACATGGSWLKWHANRPARVLYLDGEMPAAGFQERWRKVMAAPSALPMPDPTMLRLVTPDLQTDTMPDIGSEEGRAHIAELLGGVEVVVVDNISTLVRSGVENEEQSWIPIQDWALGLRRRGLAVLFVHHAGKSGQQRGTSKREDVLDSVLALRRPNPDHPEDGARFELHFEKSRSFSGADAAPLLAWMEADQDGRDRWLWEPIDREQIEQAREHHRQGKSVREISALVMAPKSTVARWIRE